MEPTVYNYALKHPKDIIPLYRKFQIIILLYSKLEIFIISFILQFWFYYSLEFIYLQLIYLFTIKI